METLQEIRAVRDTVLAQNQMAELQVLLRQEKSKTERAHVEREKAPMKSRTTELHEEGKAQFGMDMQLLHPEDAKICDIISKLQYIEGLLTNLPTSVRTKMEACFSSLLAEAILVVKEIDHANAQCDTKGSHLNCQHS